MSEDFVNENFKELGWSCFRPYADIGVDLAARKEICPKNHTKWDNSEKQAQEPQYVQLKRVEAFQRLGPVPPGFPKHVG